MNETNQVIPEELERIVLNNYTVKSVYRAGYSTITVKSTFSSTTVFSDLLCRILLQKSGLAS
jgi:hypothetical protein